VLPSRDGNRFHNVGRPFGQPGPSTLARATPSTVEGWRGISTLAKATGNQDGEVSGKCSGNQGFDPVSRSTRAC
jgi:hypothetical protein